MGKLIDIDRLCDDLVKRWSVADKKKEDLIRAVMADVVTPIVVSQPPVDAVPVRCADCIRYHSNEEVWGWCAVMPYRMRKKDYCSYGVRKDGDHETD